MSGSVLAFAQGGDSEVRLVHVTPPVAVVHHGLFAEATWRPTEMPLTHRSAPVLVDNHGGSDVPMLVQMIDDVRRSTPVARFASKFRSRCRPLPADVGRQVVAVYRDVRERGAPIARHYADSMPFPPPKIDRNRKRTYATLVSSSLA